LLTAIGLISKKYNSENHTKYKECNLKYNATITNIKQKCVKSNACIRTIITFSDGFQYISHDTVVKDTFFGYRIYVSEEMKCNIIQKALSEHLETIRSSNFTSFNWAFSHIQNYVDGKYDSYNYSKFNKITLHIANCLYVCSAYAIFHANSTQKNKIKELSERFFSKVFFDERIDFKKTYFFTEQHFEKFNQELLTFKKEKIDSSYLEDGSKENYNRLLEIYLKKLCELNNTELYDGIIGDFKHCMDK
jgi:hypothetical protein